MNILYLLFFSFCASKNSKVAFDRRKSDMVIPVKEKKHDDNSRTELKRTHNLPVNRDKSWESWCDSQSKNGTYPPFAVGETSTRTKSVSRRNTSSTTNWNSGSHDPENCSSVVTDNLVSNNKPAGSDKLNNKNKNKTCLKNQPSKKRKFTFSNKINKFVPLSQVENTKSDLEKNIVTCSVIQENVVEENNIPLKSPAVCSENPYSISKSQEDIRKGKNFSSRLYRAAKKKRKADEAKEFKIRGKNKKPLLTETEKKQA